MSGVLTLIPTPIDDQSPLEAVALARCQKAFDDGDIICVEEVNEGRRRWLRFGLPKEAIESFVLYNEHTRDEECGRLIKELNKGKNVILMSDCGLPAFCDPGQDLVNRCHNSGIKVTSAPFANSIALAIALSGFDHSRFVFEGFVSNKSDSRSKELKRIALSPDVSVVMDTPYRMKKLLEEFTKYCPDRMAFLGVELNQENEKLFRASFSKLNSMIPKEKKEFILVLGPKG